MLIFRRYQRVTRSLQIQQTLSVIILPNLLFRLVLPFARSATFFESKTTPYTNFFLQHIEFLCQISIVQKKAFSPKIFKISLAGIFPIEQLIWCFSSWGPNHAFINHIDTPFFTSAENPYWPSSIHIMMIKWLGYTYILVRFEIKTNLPLSMHYPHVV